MKMTAASVPGQSTVENGVSPPTAGEWRGSGWAADRGGAA